MKILKGPFNAFFNRSFFGFGLMFLCVFASAIDIVYNKQLSRSLHTQLQQQLKSRDQLHVEWSRLLLEQGTLASDLRVEQIARDELGMRLPKANEIMVIHK